MCQSRQTISNVVNAREEMVSDAMRDGRPRKSTQGSKLTAQTRMTARDQPFI